LIFISRVTQILLFPPQGACWLVYWAKLEPERESLSSGDDEGKTTVYFYRFPIHGWIRNNNQPR